MSTATFNSTQTVSLSYTENLSRAARAFLQALLAITPEAKPAAEEKRDVASIAQLYRMARSYDSIQPNLAQELRAIAARA